MSGLYIHIPFCKQKCNYCDFHFSVSQKNKTALIKALNAELKLRKNELRSPVKTIYFGGGTPSVLSYDELSSIFESIYANYQVIPNAEITLEANPDDLNLKLLKGLVKLGINRLSIGVQSFQDVDLNFMNRSHSAKQAIKAIKNAQDSGISNLTIDLIYGIPNLSIPKWEKNIDTFLSLDIPHLSSYALTVEPRTALAHAINKKKINPLNEDLAKAHFDLLKERMKQNAFVHYELSNFAKEGFLSKHNTSYWQGKEYLGIGPSAHSYNLTSRSWNIANNNKYINALEVGKLPQETEQLTESMRYNEYIMTGLRTMWGVDIAFVKKEFSKDIVNHFNKILNKYLLNKMLESGNSHSVKIHVDQLFLVDGLISDFFYVK